ADDRSWSHPKKMNHRDTEKTRRLNQSFLLFFSFCLLCVSVVQHLMSTVDRGVEVEERVADAGPRGRLGRVECVVDLRVPHGQELLRRSRVRLEVGALVVEELPQDLRLRL